MLKKTLGVLKESYKEEDYLWARYATRPFGAFFLACLDKTKITPNQLTFLSLIVGLTGVACMAFCPGLIGLWSAWVILQLAFIVDCMDGMQARVKKMFSPVGLKLDYLIDEIKMFFLIPAIGYRLYVETGNMWPIYISLVGTAAASTGIGLTSFMRSPEYTGQSQLQTRSFQKGVVGLIMRFFSFLINYPSWILIPVIFNRIDYFLLIFVSVHVLYVCYAMLLIVLKVGKSSHYAT